MPLRLLLIPLGLLVLGAVRFEPVALEPAVRLGAGAALVALLAAPEPALVVLVAAEAGAGTGTRGAYGYAIALAAALAVTGFALGAWRQRPLRIPGGLVVLALLLACIPDPWALVDGALAAAAAFVGTRILFPRRALGAPSLRSLLGGMIVFAWGLVLQLTMLWVLLPLLRWPVDRVRRFGRRGMRALIRCFPYGTHELDRVDVTRPAVVVSNHQSSLDIVLVLGLSGDVRLTTSPRVWDEPWLGFSARRLGHVRVDERLTESCRAVVAEGASVHVYPEGTRSRDGYPARFRRGGFELAVQLGLDVLPIVIVDSRVVVPRDAYWVDEAHLVVRALPRVPPGDDSRALQKRVQRIVREGFEREMERIHTPRYLRRKVKRHYRYQGWRVRFAIAEELRHAPVPERPGTEPYRIDGCGYGATALLMAERHPDVRIVARERDPAKLAVARHVARGHPRIRFEPTD